MIQVTVPLLLSLFALVGVSLLLLAWLRSERDRGRFEQTEAPHRIRCQVCGHEFSAKPSSRPIACPACGRRNERTFQRVP
ncbi:MAG: hypothetical protein AAF555_01355 [Verrucomicrobiota bacterium]